jgi:HSP20 family protein
MAIGTRNTGRPWMPSADIYETEEKAIVQLAVPGVQADKVDIECEKGMLSIKGERPFVENGKFYRVETPFGRFERYFEIPRTLDVNNVEATYQDGILTLAFPKTEEAKPKKIAIQVG